MEKNTLEKTNTMRKVIMTVLTVLVIIYVVYVVGRAGFTQVRTETAEQMTVYNSISSKGYIVRDETLIKYNGGGVITYAVSDGEKVSKGETVATAFASSEAANVNNEINRLNERLKSLEMLKQSDDTIAETPDALDRHIESDLYKVNIALSDVNIAGAQGGIDNVLYNINQRQLVTGKLTGLDEKINEIKTEINKLKQSSAESQKGNPVSSSATGYFVSSTDGYENFFTTDKLDDIMPQDLEDDKIEAKKTDSNVIGKTINGVYWYIACRVSADDAFKIKNAYSLSIDIPMVSNDKIPVELYSINQKSKTEEGAVILRGSYMNEEMANFRSEDVSIIIDTYNGIYVPKNAVHDGIVERTTEDSNGKEKTEKATVSGVYVRIGTELEFKQIVPLYSGEDFIISKLNPTDEELYSDDVGALQLYDEIVVEGANLYDGKIINSIK